MRKFDVELLDETILTSASFVLPEVLGEGPAKSERRLYEAFRGGGRVGRGGAECVKQRRIVCSDFWGIRAPGDRGKSLRRPENAFLGRTRADDQA